MTKFDIGSNKIFKISHGAQKFYPYYKIEEWLKKRIVVVHGQTHPIGRSKVNQGDLFTKQLIIGDYFYLCYGGVKFLTLGRITSNARPLPKIERAPINEEGYFYREYEVIKNSVNNNPYSDEKHWWTPNGNSTIWEIDSNDYALANRIIFKKYFNIEILNTNIGRKISKVCWNSNFWQFPSGKVGKSKDPKSYERKYGYGHEEWLGNKLRKVNNFIYGYLQSIAKYPNAYIGKIFDITLYSREETSANYYIIGEIKNAVVITTAESEITYSVFKKRGWLNEMKDEVEAVKGKSIMLINTKPNHFFNIRYKTEDIEIFDSPIKLNNPEKYLKENYYYHLLNFALEPNLDAKMNGDFNFKKGHNTGKTEAVINYTENSKRMELVHNKIKSIIYDQLNKKYGDKVGTENDTGYGTKVDIVMEEKGKFIFYELKTGHNLKLCIREALSQLLEYAFFPDRNNAFKLIIITHHKIDNDSEKYLRYLRNNFKIPVWYQYYNSENCILEGKLY